MESNGPDEIHQAGDQISDEFTDNHTDALIACLNDGREEDFITYFDRDVGDVTVENDTMLLQICYDKDLAKAAIYLLQRMTDPNRTYPNSQTAIELATEKSYTKLVSILLEHDAEISTTMLITCIKNILTTHEYRECYDILISHIKRRYQDNAKRRCLLLNGHDETGNTPLHYAVRCAGSDVIQELLSLGSSLGSTNDQGVMPINDIDPDVLVKHLDSCIIFDDQDKHWEKKDLQIEFKYRSLIPPCVREQEIGSTENLGESESNSSSENEPGLEEETKVIIFMSKNKKMKHLLKHPVITSYLFMKWWRFRYLCWLNLLLYLIFYGSVVDYIVLHYANLPSRLFLFTYPVAISYTFLSLALILLCVREIFQLSADPRRYSKCLENYIEIILIFMVTVILFFDFSTGVKRQLSAVVILVASFELVLLSGQLPFFCIYVAMLKTVSVNFFKMIIWYLNILSAFALSFFLLFTPLESNANPTDDNTFFETPYWSFFKTLIMMTGEFDASSINFKTFPQISVVIFLLFIFMIAIVLLNLLNGLAISDTQIIKNEAELISYVAKANYVQYIESMCCGSSLLKYLCRKFSIAQWAMESLFVTRYQLKVYPNKMRFFDGFINVTDNMCIFLDTKTLRRTNDIIQRKNEQDDDDISKMSEKIASLEKKIDTLLGMLKSK